MFDNLKRTLFGLIPRVSVAACERRSTQVNATTTDSYTEIYRSGRLSGSASLGIGDGTPSLVDARTHGMIIGNTGATNSLDWRLRGVCHFTPAGIGIAVLTIVHSSGTIAAAGRTYVAVSDPFMELRLEVQSTVAGSSTTVQADCMVSTA